MLYLDIITNIVLIILLGFYLRDRFKRRTSTPAESGTDTSAVGKFNTAVNSISTARAKYDALKAKVTEHVSGASEDLRDDIYNLHAELEAEIVYADTHHSLLG